MKKIVIIIGCLLLWGCSEKNGMRSILKGNQRQIGNSERVIFRAAIRPVDERIEDQYQLARHFQKIGKHDTAIEIFSTILEQSPDHVKSYNALGVSYDALKKYDLSLAAYENALRLKPDSHSALNNMGYSFYLQKKYGQAIDYFNKAVAIDPSKTTYQNNLGLCYAETGEIQNALDAFILAGNIPYALKMEKRLADEKTPKQPAPALAVQTHEITESVLPPETSVNLEPVLYIPPPKAERVNGERTQIPRIQSFDISNTGESEKRSLSVQKGMGIEVSNGNGSSGLAKKIGAYFTDLGFPVARMTNAPHFNFETTKIFYRKEYIAVAKEMAQKLAAQKQAVTLVESNKLRERVKLLIGKDFVPFQNGFI